MKYRKWTICRRFCSQYSNEMPRLRANESTLAVGSIDLKKGTTETFELFKKRQKIHLHRIFPSDPLAVA